MGSREYDYLLEEAYTARSAAIGALQDLILTAPRLADPRYWFKKHPVGTSVTLGGVAVAASAAIYASRKRSLAMPDSESRCEAPARRFFLLRWLAEAGRSLGHVLFRILFFRILIGSAPEELTQVDFGEPLGAE